MAAVAPMPFVPAIYDLTTCHSTNDPTTWGRLVDYMATADLAAAVVSIHNVLIATDFSHHSFAVLNYALNFVRRYSAHAEIVYVFPTDEYALAGPQAVAAAKDATRRDLLELKAKLRSSQVFESDVDYRVTMLEGPAADCLLQWAHEKNTDLIVVGTHGRGGLGKLIPGSVAEKIFRHSDVPVLTVGPHVRSLIEVDRAHRILVPCDLTPGCHPAVPLATALARQNRAKLTVLHVVENFSKGMTSSSESARQAREGLIRIVGRNGDGVDVVYRVEFGKISSSILRTASEIDADLIVLGVRPSSGVLDRFTWPIAYELVCQAECPVLTLRGSLPIR
jgi:nucleotide-binding universal stress UspA family protein